MSWAEVATRAGGYAPQESDWDDYIRDNFNGGTLVRLDGYEVTVPSAITTISFSPVDLSFKHLLLVAQLYGTSGGSDEALICRVNGVSTATYDYQTLESIIGTSVQAGSSTLTGALLGRVPTIGVVPTPGLTGISPGIIQAMFYDYSDNSGSFEKTVQSRWGYKKGISAGDMRNGSVGSFIRQTASIASLELRGLTTITFGVGSKVELYGVPA